VVKRTAELSFSVCTFFGDQVYQSTNLMRTLGWLHAPVSLWGRAIYPTDLYY